MNKTKITLFFGLLALCIGFGSDLKQSSESFAGNETVYNFSSYEKKSRIDTSLVNGSWQNKVFGHYQNDNGMKFEVTKSSEKITLDNITSANDATINEDGTTTGKNSCFTKLTSKTDSLGFYFKEIDSSKSFTLTATMDFEEIHGIFPSQDVPYANFAAGLMVRDDICENAGASTSGFLKNYVKPYVAVGNFEMPYIDSSKGPRTTHIWYRDSDTTVQKKKNTTVTTAIPTVDNLLKGAKLTMTKTGSQYLLKYQYGDVTNSYTYTPSTTLNGRNLYVGAFISGPLKVSFSNINLNIANDDLWSTSEFGAFYGSDVSKLNYNVTKKGNEVVLEDGIDSAANYSRITGTADSFLMNYKKVSINEDFAFSAKMKINDINSTNTSQVGCGIQVRDDILDNVYESGYVSSMIAAGNFGLPYADSKGNKRTNNAWYRDVTVENDKSYLGGSNTTYMPQNDESGNVINNDEVLLKIEKVGNEYTVTYKCESQDIESVNKQTLNLNNKDTNNVYVGVFISGAIKVTFSDVKLELLGNVEYVGYQIGENNNSIRFLGKVFVGTTDEDFAKLVELYRAFDFTIYAQIDDTYNYAKLETTGLMKSINNGSETLTAEDGWYYYGVIIKGIPEDVNFKVYKVETSILAVEQGDL